MRSGKPKPVLPVLALLPCIAACVAAQAQTQTPLFHVGKAATAEEIRAWDISVGTAGKELPPGSGTAKDGAPIFAQKCVACHGPNGTGGSGGALVLNPDVLKDPQHKIEADRGVLLWPFATSVWDYIHRAMPRNQPGSLSAEEAYALTAFLLYRNGIIQEGDVMDAKTLPNVPMPNRNGFVPPRLEDINQKRCRIGTCR